MTIAVLRPCILSFFTILAALISVHIATKSFHAQWLASARPLRLVIDTLLMYRFELRHVHPF
jgi:hypothetical protein